MKVSRPCVYIVQDDGERDFSDAEERFGRLVPLVTKADVYADLRNSRPREIVRVMRSKLAEFDSSRDYLLLVGDPVAIAIAVNILSEMTDRIQLLKWDNRGHYYYPIVIGERRERGATRTSRA